jgi:hypothetical protein
MMKASELWEEYTRLTKEKLEALLPRDLGISYEFDVKPQDFAGLQFATMRVGETTWPLFLRLFIGEARFRINNKCFPSIEEMAKAIPGIVGRKLKALKRLPTDFQKIFQERDELIVWLREKGHRSLRHVKQDYDYPIVAKMQIKGTNIVATFFGGIDLKEDLVAMRGKEWAKSLQKNDPKCVEIGFLKNGEPGETLRVGNSFQPKSFPQQLKKALQTLQEEGNLIES